MTKEHNSREIGDGHKRVEQEEWNEQARLANRYLEKATNLTAEWERFCLPFDFDQIVNPRNPTSNELNLDKQKKLKKKTNGTTWRRLVR